ncbi:hypothetical protein Cgig2_020297 [Carnegiea gigantea]|uniref:Uncharacterized protein n=1 Tax=Carnegiea gigantea TaxID=171969 RepID=A0A9Q1K8Q2_9CARY|nr:hypothetical protein Cgig2_020297 [Carnegiea gigantea]
MEVAFPPLPLPFDYEELCPDFVLAKDYEVPELPQVVFLTMFLNDAVKLDILRGWMIKVMESALKELRWSTFQAWIEHNRGRILEARQQEALSDSEEGESSRSSGQTAFSRDGSEASGLASNYQWDIDKSSGERVSAYLPLMAFPPFHDTEEMADHVRKTFKWHLRRASRPPHPLPEDYQDLCPSFTLSDAKEAARDFNIPEIVQAVFYAMLLYDAMELSMVTRDVAGTLKSTLKGLRWTTFESYLSVADYVWLTFMWCLRGYIHHPQLLPEDYRGLYPDFNLEVPEASTRDFHISELT